MDFLMIYQSPHRKIRIGNRGDGGYVVALLPVDTGNTETYDLLLSGGISNDISFERHFLTLYKDTKGYAFDGTINIFPETITNMSYIKKNLGDPSLTSRVTDMEEYIADKHNVFMKIDIEGHEFRLLPRLISSGSINKIKQLVVEIHSPADIKKYPNYYHGLDDITNIKMFRLFAELTRTHTLIHFHANNACGMQKINGINLPHVFELTYVRNEYVPMKLPNNIPLPTKLDIPSRPILRDYFFNHFPYCVRKP